MPSSVLAAVCTAPIVRAAEVAIVQLASKRLPLHRLTTHDHVSLLPWT
jgi:hypothetical protein